MKEILPHISDYPVYPGEFNLMPEMEMLVEEMHLKKKHAASTPLLNMVETAKSFKVEIIIPGAKRENILIEAEDNILSIIVRYDQSVTDRKLKIGEFKPETYERHILLPVNADLILLTAEYRAGILKLYIPKSKAAIKNRHTRIAVY